MTKWFKITVIGLSVALVGILAATITLLVLQEKPFLPPAPPSLIMVGEDRFLDTAVVENAKGYLFKIDNVEFVSTESTFQVTNLFAEARNYVVEVAILANKEKNNSPFSEPVTIPNRLLLPSPVLSFAAQTKTLSWSSVGTDVTYDVFANGVRVAQGLTALNYDCSAVIGESNMSVTAVPNDDTFLLPSLRSNVVNCVVTQQLLAPTNLSFDEETGILSFLPPSTIEGLELRFEINYNGQVFISMQSATPGAVWTVNLSLQVDITPNPAITVITLGGGYYENSLPIELA